MPSHYAKTFTAPSTTLDLGGLMPGASELDLAEQILKKGSAKGGYSVSRRDIPEFREEDILAIDEALRELSVLLGEESNGR